MVQRRHDVHVGAQRCTDILAVPHVGVVNLLFASSYLRRKLREAFEEREGR